MITAKEILRLLEAKSTADILKIANQVEKSGAGFFDRVGKDMNIWVRGSHGNDHNQWGQCKQDCRRNWKPGFRA